MNDKNHPTTGWFLNGVVSVMSCSEAVSKSPAPRGILPG